MITIKFYRYIATTEVIRSKRTHHTQNVFNITLDHTLTFDNSFIFNTLMISVQAWLDNHYGYCSIEDQDSNKLYHTITNYKQFIMDMNRLGIEVTIRKVSKE